MTKVNDIYEYIDSIAPYHTQEGWDNSGLNTGDGNAQVSRVLLALDLTDSVIDEAVRLGAQLIVTHHPSLFRPLKNVTADTYAYKLIKNGISALSAHTNLDAAVGGVNDVLCKLFELSDVSSFAIEDTPVELARIGTLPSPMTSDEFASYVKEKLHLHHATYTRSGKVISRVAVIGGGGGEYFDTAIQAGADALVTGEAKHHQLLDAAAKDFTVVSAGHYETENPVVSELCQLLSKRFPDVEFVVTGTASLIFHC